MNAAVYPEYGGALISETLLTDYMASQSTMYLPAI